MGDVIEFPIKPIPSPKDLPPRTGIPPKEGLASDSSEVPPETLSEKVARVIRRALAGNGKPDNKRRIGGGSF